ncbi:unnamed protein product [Symbiodinium microadriaticum]|nr:unnamed protein product [Symbiodinium microadriaticum]
MVGGYFEQELEYVLCMGPLVLAMWAMPTLHEAVTGQCSGGRQTLFSPAEMLQMHGRWMLNKPALQSGEWWRAVTHMFVHKDMDHLLQNLRGMLANGFVAFSEFGWQGPYGVFFCSGILAGLNTPGRAFQTEAQLEGSLPRVPDRLGPVAIPETARGWWDARPGSEDRAHQALFALEQSTVANATSSQDYEQALAAFEGVREEVRKMSEDVEKSERTMLEKQQTMEQDLAEKKRRLADKEASLEEAEKTKEAKRAEAEEAGQLVDKHKSGHEEADSALHAARAALEEQQTLRDEAIASHDIAKAEVIEAAKQKEELEKKHRREQESLELLKKVKREIEDFYKDTDALQASVAKEEARNPEVPAHELLAQSPKLKPALVSYNDVVKAFLEVFVHEADHLLYGTIQPAVAQIKRNSWQEILAVCDADVEREKSFDLHVGQGDPGEELEMEAEKKKNFDELQEKCGAGLWKVVGLSRLSFPTYNGASEQVEEWWDEVGETVEEYSVHERSMESAVGTEQPTTSKEDPLSETSSMSAASPAESPGDLHSMQKVEDTLIFCLTPDVKASRCIHPSLGSNSVAAGLSVTRSFGVGPFAFDLSPVMLILVTDGITGSVSDVEAVRLASGPLREGGADAPERAARALVEVAHTREPSDDKTAMVIWFGGSPDERMNATAGSTDAVEDLFGGKEDATGKPETEQATQAVPQAATEDDMFADGADPVEMALLDDIFGAYAKEMGVDMASESGAKRKSVEEAKDLKRKGLSNKVAKKVF